MMASDLKPQLFLVLCWCTLFHVQLHIGLSAACYTRVTASEVAVSVYGGEALTLTLSSDNTCGFSTAVGSTGTAVFVDLGGTSENAECEVLSGTDVVCITPQFQRLGRVRYSVTVGAFSYNNAYILVVENPKKTLGLSSVGSDTVRITWDTNEFESTDTLTLYLHDMGSSWSSTRWQGSIVIRDDIPNQGSVEISASSVLAKQYYAGSFYVGCKSPSRPRKKKRVYCGVRRFHERFWKDEYYTCQNWQDQSPNTPDDTNPCPPIESQARQDSGYVRIKYDTSFYHTSSLTCYITVSPGRQHGGQVCCYQKSNGDANCASTGRGGYTFYRSPHDYYWQHVRSDIIGWFACCTDSQPYPTSGGGGGGGTVTKTWLANLYRWLSSGSTRSGDSRSKADRCRAFYEKRVRRCGHDWERRRRGRGRGDPHITTFDGFNYTFNGHGDYWMVKHDTSCSVQARMEAVVPATSGNATIFTQVAMRCDSTNAPIIVRLNAAMDDLEVYIGSDRTQIPLNPASLPLIASGLVVATIYDNTTQPNEAAFSTKTIVLSGGADDLIVEVGLGTRQLTFVGAASSSYDGKILGLAGNSNGNEDDDLRSSTNTGTPLPKASDMSTIHYSFGETWRVTEAESFFPYNTTGSAWPPYNEVNLPSFTPSFTAVACSTDAQRQTCGDNTQCCFDFQVSGNANFAASTATFDRTYSLSQRFLDIKVQLCSVLSTAILGFQQELAAYTNGASYQKKCPEGQTPVGASTTVTCQNGIWVDLSTCVPQVAVDKISQALGKNSSAMTSLLSRFWNVDG